MNKQYFGFYSAGAVKAGHRTVIWLTPEGKEVTVTFVCSNKEGKGYSWDDTICVGEVYAYSRKGFADSSGDWSVNYGSEDPDWNF